MAFENLPPKYLAALSNSTSAALSSFPEDWPQLEILPIDAYLGNNEDYRIADPRDDHNYGSIGAALLTTTSRGNVTIRSADMADAPVIYPNWLSTKEDSVLAVAASKRIREIWSHMEGVTIGQEYYPGPNITTDAQILDNIRQQVIELYHAAAACKMGKATDSSAVIDSHARVFGVQTLRVVVSIAQYPMLSGHYLLS